MIGFEPHHPGCRHFEQVPWDAYQESIRTAGSHYATIGDVTVVPTSGGPERSEEVRALADTLDDVSRDIDAGRPSIGGSSFIRAGALALRGFARKVSQPQPPILCERCGAELDDPVWLELDTFGYVVIAHGKNGEVRIVRGNTWPFDLQWARWECAEYNERFGHYHTVARIVPETPAPITETSDG